MVAVSQEHGEGKIVWQKRLRMCIRATLSPQKAGIRSGALRTSPGAPPAKVVTLSPHRLTAEVCDFVTRTVPPNLGDQNLLFPLDPFPVLHQVGKHDLHLSFDIVSRLVTRS